MHWPHHFHNLPAFLASHSSLRSLDDCCSVTKSCSTFCDFMDYSVPGSQGTLKSFLQHHSLKASILQCLAFFIVQLSHPYMITGKIIALTICQPLNPFLGRGIFTLHSRLRLDSSWCEEAFTSEASVTKEYTVLIPEPRGLHFRDSICRERMRSVDFEGV